MKRIFILFIAALLSISLVGCSGGDNDSANKQSNNNETAQSSGDSGSGQQSDDNASAETGDGGSSGQQSGNKTAQTGGSGGDNQQNGSGKGDFSYALGMNIAGSLQQIKSQVDADQLMKGLSDALSGNDTRLSQSQAKKILQSKAQQIQAKQSAQRKQQAGKNLKKSKQFLAENKQKEGVKVTQDGLQYKVLKKGDGAQPSAKDTVVVAYKGMLTDGSVFDSTYKRGKPATFPVNAVIPGWSEALQMMHVGGKYKLFIPPALAYGEQGAGQRIGPNQALVFEVELKNIKQSQNANAKGQSGGGSSSQQAAGENQSQAGSGSSMDSDNGGGSARTSAGGSQGNDSSMSGGGSGTNDSMGGAPQDNGGSGSGSGSAMNGDQATGNTSDNSGSQNSGSGSTDNKQ